MSTMYKMIAIAAVLAGTLMMSGCGKEDAQQAAAPAPTAQADLVAPPSTDERAWKMYLVNVAKKHMDGIRSSPFMYYLPAVDTEGFQELYDRQRDNVAGAIARGVLPGNMLAFGSPDSTKMADLIVEAFATVSPGSMKDVRVLFIGATADLDRVKAAIEPSGANVVFHELK
ncbi:MAG: hypothetical protein KDI69_08565 [Xanthomonadales bacterium]|nr:hypothetical protein [Xanthomonadales bacterium]